MSEIQHGRGYVYSIKYHIVWCTKYRCKILNNEVMHSLISILNTIVTENNFTIEEVNGLADHIHLLVKCTPQHYIPSMVKALKGVSARLLLKQHPELKTQLYRGHLWNPSYFVATVGEVNEELIRNYITSQTER